MNWVYIDACTCQVRYGIRKDAQPNFTVPFDCTRQSRRLTFQGWEGFCAVETQPGVWGVYFDVEDDGLQGRMKAGMLTPGLRVLEIELQRVEKRWKKEVIARGMDQTINRAMKLDSNGREVVTDFTAPGHNPTTNTSETASGDKIETYDGPVETYSTDHTSHAAVPCSQSPTTIRVEPPVILSTHQICPNHKQPSSHTSMVQPLSRVEKKPRSTPPPPSPPNVVEDPNLGSLSMSANSDPLSLVTHGPVDLSGDQE
jgi:hypothetical protein